VPAAIAPSYLAGLQKDAPIHRKLSVVLVAFVLLSPLTHAADPVSKVTALTIARKIGSKLLDSVLPLVAIADELTARQSGEFRVIPYQAGYEGVVEVSVKNRIYVASKQRRDTWRGAVTLDVRVPCDIVYRARLSKTSAEDMVFDKRRRILHVPMPLWKSDR